MDQSLANELRRGVHDAYSAAASQSEGALPFPRGAGFAASLGYRPAWLSRFPAAAAAFAGVADVAPRAELTPGQTLLDLGCGAGLDSRVAAERLGTAGSVLALDFSHAMLRCQSADEPDAKSALMRPVQSAAEALPLRDASVDAALVNGLFNLNPHRERIFAELARVVRLGGSVWAAEIVALESRPVDLTPANWFA
jgi:SAM-dependent methyltransferase